MEGEEGGCVVLKRPLKRSSTNFWRMLCEGVCVCEGVKGRGCMCDQDLALLRGLPITEQVGLRWNSVLLVRYYLC